MLGSSETTRITVGAPSNYILNLMYLLLELREGYVYQEDRIGFMGSVEGFWHYLHSMYHIIYIISYRKNF